MQWYPNKVMMCALCYKESDSHDHLLFQCQFSTTMWSKAKQRCKFSTSSNNWIDVIDEMVAMPNKMNIRIIVKKLMFAASVYFLWQERDLRHFQNKKKEIGRTVAEYGRSA